MSKITTILLGFVLLVSTIGLHLVTAQSPSLEYDRPPSANLIPNQYILLWQPHATTAAQQQLETIITTHHGSIQHQLDTIDAWIITLPPTHLSQVTALTDIAFIAPDQWLTVTESGGICPTSQQCALSTVVHTLATDTSTKRALFLNINTPYNHLLDQILTRLPANNTLLLTTTSHSQQACFTSPASSSHVLTVGYTKSDERLPACIDILLPNGDQETLTQFINQANHYTEAWGPAEAWAKLTTNPSSSQLCDTRLYVNQNATGSNNGTSWTNAYTDLQTALTTINPCPNTQAEIWVAAGIYYPDEGLGQTNNNRQASFTLPPNVALYGGFAGTEIAASARQPRTNITVLSGDIDNNDITTNNGIITATNHIIGNNSYTVVTANGTNSNTLLSGFTITGGQANGTSPYPHHDRRGGGLYISAGNLTLDQLHFSSNIATGDGNLAPGYGGGLYLLNGSTITLTNVHIAGNEASNSGGGLYYSQSNLIIINALIAGNYAINGGGLYSDLSTTELINTTLTSNFALNQGAALRTIYNSYTQIYNSIIWDNATNNGTHPDTIIAHATNSTALLDYNLNQTTCSTDTICNNEIIGDPAFITPITATLAPTTNGDFHLDRFASDAIEAGQAAYLPPYITQDLDGNDRIEGLDSNPSQNLDLGAYEFNIPDLIITATINPNGQDLDINWTNNAEACVWIIYAQDTPYIIPQLGTNDIDAVCTSAQCYGSSYTLLNAITDTSQNDYLTIRPDECINVFDANEVGVFHISIIPGL
ncbi:MAG TPA: hypothetical protein VLL52_13665 [Anaerolineae bacterium]|nr:hypothetical protein [Anaerolineae bacterium]